MTNLAIARNNPGSLFNIYGPWSSLMDTVGRDSFYGSSSLRYRGPNHKDGLVSVDVEVPGVDPRDISVVIEGKALRVKTPDGEAYFTMGERLNSASAKATLNRGMLRIVIPTREANRIEVKVESED
ncbi:small heat shock protein [Synechococcus phage S-CBWM1]|uniref:Small heat shock protein n=1 Tax=Synechococcus phage S-CBWM1 TaxID=2053653 RepID=A0A3G1L3T8_9CAUD|nr:small heat shock protein [Synechococcus phage S-CBWM1]ATW62838.1 small heat shock protein [Synechococcus phage S-CBWM1]